MNLPPLVTISSSIARSTSPSRCSPLSPCSPSPACHGGRSAATAVRRRRSGRSWSLDSEYSDVGDSVEVSC
eukprot:CAMPEP_0197435832 /NCGR_PEP_ID=MMETSP1175-20131217/3342_1 /TAXON_ID=1003142 /ORGANISM="Triceratium dubium, Strain CCMP147" /LENGTH=70 /DNA_ID=CAMNT_0042964959 /DNA_START=52 /DNA_END=261 /DNA_ORIENTATION=-